MLDQLVWAGRSDAPATKKGRIKCAGTFRTLIRWERLLSIKSSNVFVALLTNKTAKNLQMFKKFLNYLIEFFEA
jgi:hypothetical protein